MRTTGNLTIATALVITTMEAAPAMAANDTTTQAKPAQIKHTMTARHQNHTSLKTHDDALMPRGIAAVNANFGNANASASRPAESLATQYGAAFSKSGYASDPICKIGEMVPMMDGQMHPCQ